MTTKITFRSAPPTKVQLERIRRNSKKGAFSDRYFRLLQRLEGRAQKAAVDRFNKSLVNRSFTLRKSIYAKAVKNGTGGLPDMKLGFVGKGANAAAAQEVGTKGDEGVGTIRPVRAESLTVPTEEGGALTAGGRKRFKSARDFPEPLTKIKFKNPRSAVVGILIKTSQIKKYREERKRQRKGRPFGDEDERRNFGDFLRQSVAVYLLMSYVNLAPRNFLKRGMRDFQKTLRPEIVKVVKGVLSGVS